MECNECTSNFDSPSTLASLSISGLKVNYLFKLVLDFLGHDLMSIVFGHKLLYFIYFGVFDTLRFSIYRLDVLDVMTFSFGNDI